MLYGRNEGLEDRLVRFLLPGAVTVKSLHALASKKESVSLRAVYKAVDVLIEAGVVFKVGKRVWINQEWLRTLREHLSPSVALLSPGERVSYTFNSAEHLNMFWKTVAFQLEEGIDARPFFYNPHNFWAYIPELKESEDAYYAQFKDEKKYAYFVVGGTSVADKEFKRKYQNEFFQVDTRLVPILGRKDHITIFGDFVITARLSQVLAMRLDELYEKYESLGGLLPEALEAYKSQSKVKLIFEHNASKAKRLRSLLSTNFVFPKTSSFNKVQDK